MYPLPENTVLGHLEMIEVFDYYDGPRFFLARNSDGNMFIGFWCDESEDSELWYYLAVSDDRLKDIKNKKITLRDAFLKSENGSIYSVMWPRNDDILVDEVLVSELDDFYLPPADEYL